ncbi:MAG: branched-chain amino acid transporter permease protein [Firmicutes bacterium]|nr:branched-chain amino acid transporter permease protein [Bacillota bacterium]
MAILLQNLLGGLSAGALYGLAALGLTAVFQTTGMVNFAQGDMAMVCTFVGFTLLSYMKVPYGLSLLLVLAFALGFGSLLERGLMRPLMRQPHVSQIMVTLGLAMILNGIAGQIWGFEPHAFKAPLGGDPYRFVGLALSKDSLLIFGISALIVLSLFLFFKFTLAGTALRATAQNATAAKLMGIPIGMAFNMSWAVAAVLSATAGVLIAPSTTLDPNFMAEVGIKAFAGAILGGFSSLPGAVLGGLFLGVLESLVAGYISTELKSVFSFSLILLVLVVRPYGLLGSPARKKV